MRHEKLRGWNVGVMKTQITVQGENGLPIPAEGWLLQLTEMAPPTGNTIEFEFGKDVRDYVVRELTGGIVLHGGDLPQL